MGTATQASGATAVQNAAEHAAFLLHKKFPTAGDLDSMLDTLEFLLKQPKLRSALKELQELAREAKATPSTIDYPKVKKAHGIVAQLRDDLKNPPPKSKSLAYPVVGLIAFASIVFCFLDCGHN